MTVPFLSPFVFYQRMPHITDQIFEKLDNATLKNCNEMSKSWKQYIGGKNWSWIRIVDTPKILKNRKYLHMSAKLRQLNIFKRIFEEEEFTNPKIRNGYTPFHLACKFGHFKIVEVILEKSSKYRIEINTKLEKDWTALHLASYHGHFKIVEILINKYVELKLDLSTKILSGRTAFHLACEKGFVKVVEIFVEKSVEHSVSLNAKDSNIITTPSFPSCVIFSYLYS